MLRTIGKYVFSLAEISTYVFLVGIGVYFMLASSYPDHAFTIGKILFSIGAIVSLYFACICKSLDSF